MDRWEQVSSTGGVGATHGRHGSSAATVDVRNSPPIERRAAATTTQHARGASLPSPPRRDQATAAAASLASPSHGRFPSIASPRLLHAAASTASIASARSAIVSDHRLDSSFDQATPPAKSLRHSSSMPSRPMHAVLSPMAPLGTASMSPRRSSGVSARLYSDPFLHAQLQHDSSHALIPFVPRPLAPLPPMFGRLAEWLAMLAWETGATTNRTKASQVAAMMAALREEGIRHVAELQEELKLDATRQEQAAIARTERHQRLQLLAAAADAAARAKKRTPVRFGGIIVPPVVESMPPTIRIPLTMTALVSDILFKISGDQFFSRLAPSLRDLIIELLHATYQGYSPTPSAPSTPLLSSPSSPSLEMLPYFNVAHRLNLDYHTGQALIDSYTDAQKVMHVQGLKRGDVLNGAVRRMQRTLNWHTFQRWRHVVRERKRQKAAHAAIAMRVLTDPRHLRAHFIKWRLQAQCQRRAKDEEIHVEELEVATRLQVKSVDSRKDSLAAQELLKTKKEKALYLSREVDDVRRNLHHIELQQAALHDMQIHRLLDSGLELLLASLEGMSGELEIARQLNLQDPLRLLHPLRTSWEWDSVYQDTALGSNGWASLRRKEVEAARCFFDGSGVQYDNALAHTHADADTNRRSSHRRKSSALPDLPLTPSASLASTSVAVYNYAQEVELILLWSNFLLIESQRKTLDTKQAGKAGSQSHRAKGVPEGEEDVDSDADASSTHDWSADSPLTPTKITDDLRSNKKRRTKLQRGRAALSRNLDTCAVGLFGQEVGSAADSGSESDSSGGMKNRHYYIEQFTNADALARRVDNFTTSLQDSELLLRLMGEIAPDIADLSSSADVLMHIDLGTRAKLLIRMIEKYDSDLEGSVTSLDIVHAFNSDRVAALLARLMIANPMVPIQGCWFDEHDHQHRMRKPFLAHTNAARLKEQMAATGTRATGITTTNETDETEAFGPLAQLQHEVIQLQQSLSRRNQLSSVHMMELSHALKQQLASGRRVMDDAYLRHELWCTAKTRLKSFVSSVFVAHIRGRPLKLDDPRAQKERELFCSLLESPMDVVWRQKQEQHETSRRELTTTLQRVSSMGHKQAQSMQIAMDALTLTEDLAADAAVDVDESDSTTHWPHGKPQSRFLDLVAPENTTFYDEPSLGRAASQQKALANAVLKRRSLTNRVDHADGDDSSSHPTTSIQLDGLPFNAAAASASHTVDTSSTSGTPLHTRPSSSMSGSVVDSDSVSPLHALSFELHVIQNLLLLFYEPLRLVWKSYAQADATAHSGIAASNTMNLLECFQLVRDCSLSSPTTLTAKQVEQAFLEVSMTQQEKKDKVATAASGNLHALVGLAFDPVTGAVLPPRDKDKLELSECDFIELLCRLAFLRKSSKEEKVSIIAEWREFQAERVAELQRAAAQQASASAAWNTAGNGNPGIADPLAHIMSGRRSSFNAAMHDGLSVASANTTIDDTFGLDFSNNDVNKLNLGLSLRFFGMLKLKILPNAAKLDTDTFRAQYKTAAVSKLLRKHGGPLRRLFFKYATLHSVAVSVLDGQQADSWANTIDYSEFLQLLRDLHLLVDGNSGLGGKEASKMLLTHDQCYSIFANVQQELHVANTSVVSAQVTKKVAGATEDDKRKKKSTAKRKSGAAVVTSVTASKKKSSKPSRSKKKKATARASQEGPLQQPDDAAPSAVPSLAAIILPAARNDSDSSNDDDDASDGTAHVSLLPSRDHSVSASRRHSVSSIGGGDEITLDGQRTPSSVASRRLTGDGLVIASSSGTASPDNAETLDLDLDPLAANPLVGGGGGGVTASQSADDSEMIFPEYLESLAAIACFRYANPYKTTAEKVESFLDNDMLPFVARLVKRVHTEEQP